MVDAVRGRRSRRVVTGVVVFAVAATAVVLTRAATTLVPAVGGVASSVGTAAVVTPGPGLSVPLPQSRLVTADVLMPWLRLGSLAGKVDLDEPASAPVLALSSAPTSHAMVAASDPADQRRIFVLGDDSRWRLVDVPLRLSTRGDGVTVPPLTPGAISADATMLAVPQPRAVVVVDVTTGRSRSFSAGSAHNTTVGWSDDRHVLVSEDGASSGFLVDISRGGVSTTPYGPMTAMAGQGLTLDWAPDPSHPQASVLRWSDGTSVPTLMNNVDGIVHLPPLVGPDVVVGHNLPLRQGTGVGAGSPPDHGIVVVDRRNGDPLLYQPTVRLAEDPTALLHLEGDLIVFSSHRTSTDEVLLLGLSWRTRSTSAFARFPAHTVLAWGRGWP